MEKVTESKRVEYTMFESYDKRQFDTEQECLDYESKTLEKQTLRGLDKLKDDFSDDEVKQFLEVFNSPKKRNVLREAIRLIDAVNYDFYEGYFIG